MVAAIRIHQTGGPEVQSYEDIDLPPPGPGELRVRQTAIGVNYIDVYFRVGRYPAPLPFVPGNEGAGVVEALGPGVDGFAVGDRVAFAATLGSYAAARNIAADRAVPLPTAIADETAAAMMLKGMTAQYLLRRTFRVERGHTILVHAAAGGVGLILCQWAAHLGATVIGTVGSPEKAALAKAHGCHHTILYREQDFVAEVARITGGEKCEVVYDSVAAAVYPGSLDCLKPLGMWALHGQSSGSVPPIDPAILQQKGSLFMTRPTMFHYVARREDLLATAQDLFDVVASGAVRIEVNQRWPLREAAAAHRALEARETTGSTVLLP
jgi:NADPH2:quinone reductase